MKTIILAGGKGTRLAPYTTIFPKPLVPIGDRPILEIIIRQLVRQGLGDILLSVGHLGELIEAYFQNGHRNIPGLTLEYFREKQPLGTAGSLAMISGLDETFLAMNGDILTTLDYQALIKHHREKRAALTIAMHEKDVKVDLGVLETSERGELTGYREKPLYRFSVSMGIYVYEPHVLGYMPKGQYMDFPDLVKLLLNKGERIVGYPSQDYWLDIGRREDYELAQLEFNSRAKDFQVA
ncbi:MAG: NTP transferase domain-containing protein [Acidobacteria bacterium]|nr:NTP transferase domain-containing protein [Acidobacteriota bacterium]